MRGDSASAPIVETLEMRTLLSVNPVLVKDIVIGAGGSDPSEFVNVNGTLFFTAVDGTNGRELWKSDGTAAGTTLFKDIKSGVNSSAPSSLTNVNGTLFFSANDDTTGDELWKSDGTVAGTTIVKNINSGVNSSNPSYLVNVNGTLFFRANNGVNGYELWKSDGTSATTTLVKDIVSGSDSSFLRDLTNVNGTLFFRANDGVNGYELWKSDGTSAGTTLVKDIKSGVGHSFPDDLTNVNGTLFFRANDGTNGYELWQSDGTSAGTTLVKDSYPGFEGSSPSDLTNVNGTLFFSARDAVNREELWQSDGTSAGTTLVKDIRPYPGNSSIPRDLTNVNGTLFFRANDGVNGNELWQSDGTSAGTTLVKDIISGIGNSNPYYLTNMNGTLFFTAQDGVNGIELWKADVPADTPKVTAHAFSFLPPALVKDIRSGYLGSSNPGSLTNVNDTLFFTADDGTNGVELWQSDGTSAGTTLVKNINSGVNSSAPGFLTNVNGKLFFSANDGTNGTELWQSDGTSAGTTLVKDIYSGSNLSSNPSSLTNVNGTLFFTANDGSRGVELWKSDGTSAGTTVARDTYDEFEFFSPSGLTNVNGTLFFTANDTTNGNELWKSDGTFAGTTFVKDIRSGSNGSNPGSLTNMNGTLFFRANDGTNGYELWQSDGTSAGTTLVKDIRSGSNGSNLGSLTNVNGTLFFRAHDGTTGFELWQSDGTSAGTTLFKDIRPGGDSSTPTDLTNVNGTLFFRANGATDGVNGYELWSMASIDVTVNNAPVLVTGNGPALAVQTEDDLLASGTTVAFLAAAASDVDADAQKGIAIHLTSGVESGQWQATTDGGSDWFTFASLGFARTRSVAFLMPANGTLSRIRFVPNKDFNGTVQLGYYAWDQTQGTAYDNIDISTNNKLGGITAFSTGSRVSKLTVSAVNDAPKWPLGDPQPAMVVQNEDDRLASGTTVASLTATASDVDAGAKKGIAIFSAPSDKGVWQFTINGGTTWTNIPATSRTNARLLPANGNLSRVRFVPNQDFNGTVQLGYYAWDQTQGTSGGIFDISTTNKRGGMTAFSTGLHFSNLTVSAVNDAPKWPSGDPRPAMVVQNEDDRLASGTTVASLTTTASDVDAAAKKGIAIFSASSDKGVWQFTINGGTTWTNLPATSRTNARLLPANGNLSRVRFVPNQDFNGTVQLGFYAWDQTQGTAGGTFNIATANKLGGTTAFSTGLHFSNLTVSAVNDAPKWPNGDPRPAMVVQNEDDRLASGTTVASLTTTASDVDAAAKKGIAIFEASSDKGVWQFTINGGTTWTNIPATSRTNARLLPANGNLSRVRFVPNKDFNGTVQLGFYAWDQTQGTAGGTFNIATNDKLGGTTAFSTGLHRSILTVSPVNDAPEWLTGPPAMAVQTEDDRLAFGTTVVSLTAASIDVDAGAKKGIAIFSAPTVNGVWQFTINGGSTWTTLPATSRSNARLLPANGNLSRIRFVPNKDFNGKVQLGYYAWDQTQGTHGGTFDVSTANKLGGMTAFSTGIHFPLLTVSAVPG